MSGKDAVEKRKPLTAKQRAQLALDQGGLCGCGCGVKLDHAREGTIDEHLQPLELLGSNDLSNRALYRLPCAKLKTKDDVKAIWKAKRLAGETGTTRKKKPILRPANPWPPKGSRRLGSRPFR